MIAHRTRPDWIVALLALAIGALGGETVSIAVGLAFFTAGLPHGFVRGTRSNPRLKRVWYWIAYLLGAALVVAAFLLAPIAALAAFLALSLVHFAMSHAHGDRLFNLAIGLLIVGGSALFQPSGTAAMLSAVAGQPVPPLLMSALVFAGAAGTALSALLCLSEPKRHASLIVAVGLMAALHPVLAVGGVFFLYHAAPIQHRAASAFGKSPALMLGAAVIALSVSALAFEFSGIQPSVFQIAIASACAIALITPHLFEDLIDLFAGR